MTQYSGVCVCFLFRKFATFLLALIVGEKYNFIVRANKDRKKDRRKRKKEEGVEK